MRHRTLASSPALWASIPCPRSELRLDLVLASGQSFRWREHSPAHWSGVLGSRVWTLTQTDERLYCTVYPEKEGRGGRPTPEDLKAIREYFRLDVSLARLYSHWGSVDPHFQKVAQKFQGVRLLRQDPTECLFSFICSSNNNIARITGMVERLCQSLGPQLIQLDDVAYHGFPSLQALAGSEVEPQLRKLGLGYRARYVCASAQAILKEQGGLAWLQQLREAPYEEAHQALCALPGVGTKVADCVCLMALDKPQAVPVDVHMWQIAQRDYSWHPTTSQAKGPNPQANKELGEEKDSGPCSHPPSHRSPKLISVDQGHVGPITVTILGLGTFFRSLWGPCAGWAQAVLFSADLRQPHQAQEPPAKRRKASKGPEG